MRGQLEDLEGIKESSDSGVVELVATKNGREVLLRGTLRAALVVTCVRCLEEFDFPVDVELEVLMLPGRPAPRRKDAAQEDDEKDELGVERYQGDTIVLDGLIRDTLLLEVPMNPSCGESCRGWDHLSQ